jgi:hypothetical protein
MIVKYHKVLVIHNLQFLKTIQADPFKSLDDLAVGSLIRTAVTRCKQIKPFMECSIAEGDHTSDPR